MPTVQRRGSILVLRAKFSPFQLLFLIQFNKFMSRYIEEVLVGIENFVVVFFKEDSNMTRWRLYV